MKNWLCICEIEPYARLSKSSHITWITSCQDGATADRRFRAWLIKNKAILEEYLVTDICSLINFKAVSKYE